LPQEVIAAFDATQTYARYERLVADILKCPPQTGPAAQWLALLPEPLAGAAAALPSGEKDALRVIAEYEAAVAERDACIQDMTQPRTRRFVALWRILSRFIRTSG